MLNSSKPEVLKYHLRFINFEQRLLMQRFYAQAKTTRFRSLILRMLALTALLGSNAVTAFDDPFSSSNAFLPVEEAYQAVVNYNDKIIEVHWQAEPGYYLYQHQFKIDTQSAENQARLPLSFEPGKRKFDEYFNKELVVYYNSTTVKGDVPDTIEAPFDIILTSQACADAGLCYPPRKQYFEVTADGSVLEKDVDEYADLPAANASHQTGGDASSSTSLSTPNATSSSFLPLVLLGALFGGLILNLMPCVFPVLSLKALSFASANTGDGASHVMHGWAYTAGVVISFVVAAIAILATRQAGEALGWGFQLQQPVFVALMAYLFFVMGLSLSGFIEIGTQWMGAGQNLTQGGKLSSSFFTGVLAAVVASPCTAPFMASALGFALTQPIAVALLVFIVLGFGMALPFLLLSYAPSLIRLLPKPGAWMETLKQFLAFPLYATCVWLIWVLGHQVSSDGAAYIVLGGVILAFALWLIKLTPNTKFAKLLQRGSAVAAFIFAFSFAFDVKSLATKNTTLWEPYSAALLEEYRAEKTPVFIDLTADWCITCKVNERIALHTDKVNNFAIEEGVILMKGDWTNSDPAISKLLAEFGRSGVPLYLMYPSNPHAPPVVLPQILTESMVINAMQAAL